jgi:hypothetical protein
MSDQVTVARHQQFNAMVKHLLQQRGSKLRSTVTNSTHSGRQAVALDQVGSVEALEQRTRHEDLPVVSVPHRRRWVFPKRRHFREFVDRADTLRMLWEPGNKYAESFAMSLGRAQDSAIIAAATGTAVVGEVGDGSETEAFDTAYQVASGGVGMTMDKLRLGLELLEAAEVDPSEEEIYLVVAARQARELRNETQVISRDYQPEYTLKDGRLNTLLGFNIKRTQRLALSGGVRTCLLYAKSGIDFSTWEDTRTPIDWIPEKQAWQVAATGDFGATRLEQGRVVSILCAEA